MRKLLIAASVLCALSAGHASAMTWVKGGSSDTEWKYLSDSAYVDKTTGLVHVEVCTIGYGCRDTDLAEITHNVGATDAIIDCAKKTITWMDNFEAINVDTLVSAKRAARTHARIGSPFDRNRRGQFVATSDEGRVVAKMCAQKAMLPKRLAPDAPGAGFSIRRVEDIGDEAQSPPRPGDERVLLHTGPHAFWLRPEVIVDRTMLEDARVSAKPDAFGFYTVDLTLTEEGARRFAQALQPGDASTAMVALVVDNDIVSLRESRDPIVGRTVQLTETGLTLKQATALARLIAVITEHTVIDP